MKRRISILGTVVILVAFYILMISTAQSSRGATAHQPGGSSISADPQGSLAVAQLWRKLQLKFSVWEQVPGLLPEHAAATFVSVEPEAGQYSVRSAQNLLNWVKAGNRAIWVTTNQSSLTNALHLRVKATPAFNIHALVSKTSEWQHLALEASHELDGSGLTHAYALYQTPSGHVVGAIFRLGQGQLQVWSTPDFWENRAIDRQGNLAVVWHLMGGRPVLWDEYGHGVVAQSLLGFMFGNGRQLSFVAMFIGFLLFLYYGLRRFGRQQPSAEDLPRLSTEFTEALAWHLSRPRLRPYLMQLLDAAVRRWLSRKLGLRSVATDAALERASRSRPELHGAFQAYLKGTRGIRLVKRSERFKVVKLTRDLVAVMGRSIR